MESSSFNMPPPPKVSTTAKAPASKVLSLRPWPTAGKKPKNITEFIERVSAQPGGFRGITEESLRGQIEKLQNGASHAGDVEMRDESDGGDGDDDPAAVPAAENPQAGREKVLKSMEYAHQTAMVTVDFVSLLLSKEFPVQANVTLSSALRGAVGIGTLGADKVAESNLTDTSMLDNKTVATGWKLLDIDKTVSSVVSAASRLQSEIQLETRYWAEVLAVSDGGWAVSRLPNERHTLGVKYGFSEAAPSFRNNSTAPLRRGADGTVDLDTGRLGESQRVLVTIEKHGKVAGRSSLPKPLPDGAPLKDRVLEARNTIFSRELWHELTRECRTLLSYNVRLGESAITLEIRPGVRIVLRPQSLQDYDPGHGSWGSAPEDNMAETISTALYILLNHAHRQNGHRRLQHFASPIASQTRSTNPTYFLMRPVIAFLTHEDSLAKATKFMSDLTALLNTTGLISPTFTLREPPTSLRPGSSGGPASSSSRSSPSSSASEALCAALLNPREFLFVLQLTPEARVSVRARTTLAPAVATQYLIQLLPPLAPHAAPLAPPSVTVVRNPLQNAFPPTETYPFLRDVAYYLRQAAARVLALRAAEIAATLEPTPEGEGQGQGQGQGDGQPVATTEKKVDIVKRPQQQQQQQTPPQEDAPVTWRTTAAGRSIRHNRNWFRELRFDVCRRGAPDRWDEMDEPEPDEERNGSGGGEDGRPADDSTGPSASATELVLTPELRIFASWPVSAGKKEPVRVVRRKWAWTAEGAATEQHRGEEESQQAKKQPVDVLRGYITGELKP